MIWVQELIDERISYRLGRMENKIDGAVRRAKPLNGGRSRRMYDTRDLINRCFERVTARLEGGDYDAEAVSSEAASVEDRGAV